MPEDSDELVDNFRPFHETKLFVCLFLRSLDIDDPYYLFNHNLSLNRSKLTLELYLVRFPVEYWNSNLFF